MLLTLWESLDAIKQFAGPDFEKARYYPEDDEYLMERELTVITTKSWATLRRKLDLNATP